MCPRQICSGTVAVSSNITGGYWWRVNSEHEHHPDLDVFFTTVSCWSWFNLIYIYIYMIYIFYYSKSGFAHDIWSHRTFTTVITQRADCSQVCDWSSDLTLTCFLLAFLIRVKNRTEWNRWWEHNRAVHHFIAAHFRGNSYPVYRSPSIIAGILLILDSEHGRAS